MNVIYYISVFVIALILVALIDIYQVRKLRNINKKISDDPDFLKDEDKRTLRRELLNQIYFKGPFTIIEMRKLNNHLKNYKE